MAGEGEAPKQEAYVPRNVLVTGGAGFIGSHVTSRLVNNYPQYKVRGARVDTELRMDAYACACMHACIDAF